MTRQRNPRAQVVEVLRDMSRRQKATITRWTDLATGMVYDGGPVRRRRRDEYPENRSQAWTQLALDMNQLIEHATAVRDFALRCRDEVEAAARQDNIA